MGRRKERVRGEFKNKIKDLKIMLTVSGMIRRNAEV